VLPGSGRLGILSPVRLALSAAANLEDAGLAAAGERVGGAPEERSGPRALLSPDAFQDETPTVMLVAEVTTTDLQKTRYQVESKDDISKTRQGYKIETIGGETVHFSEEDVESISVVEE
jgi:mRNA-degrading endonuclease toxin of MazEF toxin-antitoxin module